MLNGRPGAAKLVRYESDSVECQHHEVMILMLLCLQANDCCCYTVTVYGGRERLKKANKNGTFPAPRSMDLEIIIKS